MQDGTQITLAEREIQTGGAEEFVVVGKISLGKEKFIFAIEAKRSSPGLATKQCLLAVRDMRDTNAGGNVYGFVTTGKAWRMLKYDPASANMPRTGSDLDSNASISKPSLSSASAWGNLE
jgi:hypothetical protein